MPTVSSPTTSKNRSTTRHTNWRILGPVPFVVNHGVGAGELRVNVHVRHPERRRPLPRFASLLAITYASRLESTRVKGKAGIKHEVVVSPRPRPKGEVDDCW